MRQLTLNGFEPFLWVPLDVKMKVREFLVYLEFGILDVTTAAQKYQEVVDLIASYAPDITVAEMYINEIVNPKYQEYLEVGKEI